MAFEEIIGHKKEKETLENVIKQNKVLHGYLFSGQEGIGKFLMAKEFAKAILCENTSNTPCKKCKSCIEFESGNNPDYNIINPDGSTIKIEQIRYMNSKILEKPIHGGKKVYIINNSEKMTKEAQNCLLKTLEEPPEYAVIILICSQEGNLLTTIKSRCTKLDFTKLSNEEIKQYFTKIGENLSDDILELAEGSISKALKRTNNQESYINIKHLLEKIENITKLDMLKQEFIYKEKDNIQDLLDVMSNNLFQIAKEKVQYLNCIEIIEQTKKDLDANGNFDMCIDNLLLSIWEEINEKHSRS